MRSSRKRGAGSIGRAVPKGVGRFPGCLPLQERSCRLDRKCWVEMLCDTAIELLRELQRDSILPAYNVRARAR